VSDPKGNQIAVGLRGNLGWEQVGPAGGKGTKGQKPLAGGNGIHPLHLTPKVLVWGGESDGESVLHNHFLKMYAGGRGQGFSIFGRALCMDHVLWREPFGQDGDEARNWIGGEGTISEKKGSGSRPKGRLGLQPVTLVQEDRRKEGVVTIIQPKNHSSFWGGLGQGIP